jgi:SAM-dependent methyltransferase
VARGLNVRMSTAQAALDALVAAGLLRRGCVGLRDSYAWRQLDDGRSSVEDVIAVLASRLDDADGILGVSTPSTQLSDRTLTLAHEHGPLPDERTLEVFRSVFATVPEYRDRLQSGGRLLDVGCGIGTHLITSALLFSRSSALGVDISSSVIDEAERRIVQAGVGDRVIVKVQDAQYLTAAPEFDVAFWAQPFFSRQVRRAVLSSVHRTLHPGGLLLMQEMFQPPDRGDLHALLDAARYESWDIPFARPAEELAEEAASGGFSLIAIVDSPVGRLILSRRTSQ